MVINNMTTRLFELRKAKKITQQRLAVDLGIDQASISNYESGKYMPTVEVLIKLADYFCVSTDYLLGLTDTKRRIRNDRESFSEEFYSLYASLPANYKERILGYCEALLEEYRSKK